MRATRDAQILRMIPVLTVVCLVGLPAHAADTGASATKASTQTSRYVFLSDQSKLVQTGGIAGVHWTYSVEGQFQLAVERDAGTASFAHVDANATDDSPFQRTLDPNDVFNLTSLVGTVVDDTTIQFTGQASDASEVRITVTLHEGLAHLIGQTTPPPNSADFFIFHLDAVAQRKYSGGSGTADDPYQIATAADLIALGETPEDYDKHFILTADIDLDPNLPGRRVFDKAVIAPDSDPHDWRFQGTPFKGVFDGNAHTISHLTIIGGSYLGLFGQTASGAAVKDLRVVDVTIAGSGDYVGALAGGNSGAVTRCYSAGAVSGERNVGGLAGANPNGNVTWCYSTVAVSGRRNSVGVGGLVGVNEQGIVTACYCTGAVTGGHEVGGLVGCNNYTDGDTSPGRVVQCYSTGPVSGESCVGGLVGMSWCGGENAIGSFWDVETSGETTSDGGTGKTTAEMQTATTFLDAGWDFVDETANGTEDIWWINEGKDYPRLSWEPRKYSGGTGEPNDPYQIATAADLIALGETPGDYGKHFILTADIDLDPNLPGRKVFDGSVIAPDTNDTQDGFQGTPFAGVFDGNDHTISHVTVTGGSYLGLFGRLGREAEVKDLGTVDLNVTASGSYVGGLAGHNYGTVTQCYSTGTVSGQGSVGGLVGLNYGTVTRCYSTGTVAGGPCVGGLVGRSWYAQVTQCYSTAAVSGTGWETGGLVGYNEYGDVAHCYSTGAVRGNNSAGGLAGANSHGTVTQCYSTGRVGGSGFVGGLVARNFDGEVAGCFWDVQTSGQATSAGGTGKTTAEMQATGTFLDAGWDFVGETANGTGDIWWILEGKGYPRLWWEAQD